MYLMTYVCLHDAECHTYVCQMDWRFSSLKDYIYNESLWKIVLMDIWERLESSDTEETECHHSPIRSSKETFLQDEKNLKNMSPRYW